MLCLEHNDEDEQHEYEDADHNGRALGHIASKLRALIPVTGYPRTIPFHALRYTI